MVIPYRSGIIAAVLFVFYAVLAVSLPVGRTRVQPGRALLDLSAPMEIPHGWRVLRRADPGHPIKLIVAVKQRNLETFFELFRRITNPQSDQYGNYLTVEDLTEILADEEALHEVESWLDSYGITQRQVMPNKDFVKIIVPGYLAEELLDTQYFEWEHPESLRPVVRSLGPYTVPIRLAPHIDFITGSLGLPMKTNPQDEITQTFLQKTKKQDLLPIDPEILRIRYNISKNYVGGNPRNRQAVVEFLENYYNPHDVEKFFKTFWPHDVYNYKIARIIGPNDENKPTFQASVDVEYLMGVAPNITTWMYINSGGDFWSDLTEWINQLSVTNVFWIPQKDLTESLQDIPLVHTLAYGDQGEGPSQTYRDRISTELAKLGIRGISILTSTGDMGTGCYLCYYFAPSFPSTSPYITAVGSTRFMTNSIGPEVSTVDIPTGGGFSWNFEQPEYQSTVVTKYFNRAQYLPALHYYNPYGRAIPDVSALGTGYQVIVNGQHEIIHGKGTACTTFASIISLLNEIRLRHNLKPLGFLNDWLYQVSSSYPTAFFDVVEGNNRYGCCGLAGFYAAPGWDPVSGLGTPNFEVLRKIVLHAQFGLRGEPVDLKSIP